MDNPNQIRTGNVLTCWTSSLTQGTDAFSSLPRNLERGRWEGPRWDLSIGDVDSKPGAARGVQLGGRAEEKSVGAENKGIEIWSYL